MKNTTDFLVSTWICSLVFGNLLFLISLYIYSWQQGGGLVISNGLEIISGCCVISFLGSIPAMILFAIALAAIKRIHPDKDISTALLVLSAAGILFILLIIVMIMIAGFEGIFSGVFMFIFLAWSLPTSGSIIYFSEHTLFPKAKSKEAPENISGHEIVH